MQTTGKARMSSCGRYVNEYHNNNMSSKVLSICDYGTDSRSTIK